MDSMKLKKVNRERRQIIYFTDKRGIRRPAIIIRDDLSNAKKPPRWMQEIMNDDLPDKLTALKKGA